jgi:hypothetical protein
MTRRLFNLLSGASLLLLTCVVAASVTGYGRPLQTETTDRGDVRWIVGTHLGSFSIQRHHWNDPALAGRPGQVWQRGRWGFYLAGSYFWSRNGRGDMEFGSMRWVTIPAWAVAVPLAVLPALTARRFLRRRREQRLHSQGQCVRCGYDLRATPGRCPECGATATEAASS